MTNYWITIIKCDTHSFYKSDKGKKLKIYNKSFYDQYNSVTKRTIINQIYCLNEPGKGPSDVLITYSSKQTMF